MVQLRYLHPLFIYCIFLILQRKSLFLCFITVEEQAESVPVSSQEGCKDHQMLLLGIACPFSMVTTYRLRRDIIVPGLAKMRVNQTLTNEGIYTQRQHNPYPLTTFTARLDTLTALA